MGQPYKTIVAKIAERVPEIAPACQPETESFLQRCQRGSSAPLTAEDVEYLRALQKQHPSALSDRVEEPLTYIVFENDFIRFFVETLHDPTKHSRLQELLQWLEELSTDSDVDVRNLVGVGFCEWLVSSGQEHLQQLWPLMGDALRQDCREFEPHFRMSEENRHLLRQR